MKIRVNDAFTAIVKKGPLSLTLEGDEGAGKELGPFTAEEVKTRSIESLL